MRNLDGLVSDRASATPPSKKRRRCNLLASALFGRPVFDEMTGEILDAGLAAHGYHLWTGAVGTIIGAQQRDVDVAGFVVQQFAAADLDAARRAGDACVERRLDANATASETFAEAFRSAGGLSHETDYVQAGTPLHVIKVNSLSSRRDRRHPRGAPNRRSWGPVGLASSRVRGSSTARGQRVPARAISGWVPLV